MQQPAQSADIAGHVLLNPGRANAETAACLVVPASDVDSDVLSSDGADDEGDDDEDLSEGEEEEEDDFFSRDDLYNSFIQSVFAADDDNDRHSLCSGTDEDDEEYRPQSARGSVGEPEPDDEEDDVDIKTITNRELKQLVDYSWRMVTSNPAEADRPDDAAAGGGGAPEDHRSAKDKNLMSALLEKLLAGEEASGICVDGIQVDSLRRLVARQMSMVLQVLVEMLLLCENRSSCDNECFKYLMELGNYREGSVRKSTLMKLQTKNVHKYTKQCADDSSFGHPNKSCADGEKSSDSDDDSVGFHLTRAQVAAVASGRSSRGKHTPTSSVFDVPAFADINALLLAIDTGRRLKISEAAESSASHPLSVGDQVVFGMQPPITPQQQWAKTLDALPEKVRTVLSQFQSRLWQCLIPRIDYPCRDAISGVVSDPTSLLSRSLFTPAEDDLLLRGLMYVGQMPGTLNSSDNIWTYIQEKFLPSKDKQLLEFRYTQLINSDSPEGYKFKIYLRLMKERGRNQRKWSLEEDIDLLKGFQIYGDKWPMINLYFLPHRSRRELKSRWGALLKESSKSSSDGQGPVRQDGTISTSLASFLAELRTRGAQAEDVPMIGTGHAASNSERAHMAKVGADFLQTYPHVSTGGVRAIDTHIRASLHEADEDVLMDSDSDEANETNGMQPYQAVSEGTFPKPTLPPLPRAHLLNVLDRAIPTAPVLNSPENRKKNVYIAERDQRQDADSLTPKLASEPNAGISIPYVSQFGFSFEGGFSEHFLSVAGARSPQTLRKAAAIEFVNQNSSHVFENSLGAFNFTVPHGIAGESSRPGLDLKAKKRSADEMSLGQLEASQFFDIDLLSPEKKLAGEENRSICTSGASLFERVTQPRFDKNV